MNDNSTSSQMRGDGGAHTLLPQDDDLAKRLAVAQLTEASFKVLMKFLAYVRAEEGEEDADPRTDALTIMARKFVGEADQYLPELTAEAESFLHEMMMLGFERRRRDPFKRLLVGRFEDVLADNTFGRRDVAGRYIGRTMLPAFFHVISTLIGDDIVRDLADRARLAQARFTVEEEGRLDWDAMQQSDEAREVVWRTLYLIAHRFRRFEARRLWFIHAMNHEVTEAKLARSAFTHSGLANPIRRAFAPSDFLLVFRKLYQGVDPALEDPMNEKMRSLYGKRWDVAVGRMVMNLYRYG